MELRENLFFIYAKEFDSFEEKVSEILVKKNQEEKILQNEIYDQKEIENSVDFLISLKSKNLFAIKKLIFKIDSFDKIPKQKLIEFIEALIVTKNWVFFWSKNGNKKHHLPSKIKEICNFHVATDFSARLKKTWIKKFVKDKNIVMEEDAMNYLIKVLPNSLSWVKNELNKIEIYYLRNETVLTINDLKQIVFYQVEEKVFALIEQIIQNNQSKVVEEYLGLEETGTSALYLTSILGTYLLTMKKAEIHSQEGKSLMEISMILNKKPFYIGKLLNLSRSMNPDYLLKLVKKLIRLEEFMKTKPLAEKTLLESFLLI